MLINDKPIILHQNIHTSNLPLLVYRIDAYKAIFKFIGLLDIRSNLYYEH